MSSHSKSSLKDGLAALKKEDYRTAKIILEDVAARNDDTNKSLQAQVGLVVAYSRSDEIEMAIAVCESLVKSNNSQVQQWAENSLKQLRKKYPDKNKKLHSTGFVAFESPEDEQLVSEFPSITTPAPTPPPPPPPPLFSNSNSKAINTSTLKETQVQTKRKPRGGEIVPVSTANSKTNSPSANINSNIHWRLGGRAKVWQPLPKAKFIKSIRLPLLGIGTFVALFWMVRALVQLAIELINDILVALPFLEPIQFLYKDPTNLVLGIFMVILAVSPWLLDWLLCKFYKKKELSRETLNTYSHEAVRVLQRYCKPRGWSLPKFCLLPMA
ncbi:MAG: Zn-dependent protease with chaperone function, partial [Cyanobacteria bacterium P01_C01_bin.38]